MKKLALLSKKGLACCLLDNHQTMKAFFPGWQQKGSVLAFPCGWQRPAKTEEWAYERCLRDLPENRFAQIVCFPWATLIDLKRKGKLAKAQCFLEALYWTPPKTTLIRATVIQHIYAKDVLPFLEQLGITDLFWSHATKSEIRIGNIRIHPFPLYPVCGEDIEFSMENWLIPSEREYLYSFIGFYNPTLYLTESRRGSFELASQDDALIVKRNEWHFEATVYGGQVEGTQLTEKEKSFQNLQEKQYEDVLQKSIFSLCPSGSGPNTIRFWESIGMGALPVLLSENYWMPGESSEWDGIVFNVDETREAILSIPTVLRKKTASMDLLLEKQMKMRKYFDLYGPTGFITDIIKFFGVGWQATA